ncbi:MAG: FKBP-type peptidyl-prolyl cis-trans isomerase [Clostridia bacterium]|nr:FKBP-type peptidyl-prolyl cis-trans isomerase [Clostridia bacterium]
MKYEYLKRNFAETFRLVFIFCFVIVLCVMVFSGCSGDTAGNTSPQVTYSEDAIQIESYLEYVKLGQYKGIKIEKAISPSELDIHDAYLEMMSACEFDGVSDRAVEDGDAVSVNFTAYIGDEAVDGVEGTDVCLIIGSDSFVEEFENACVGVMPGEEFDINITFDEDYTGNEALAGNEVTFRTEINYIYPPLSDETAYVASQGTFQTADELRDYIVQALKEDMDEEWESEKQNLLLNEVYANSEIISYPDGLIENYISELEAAAEYNKVTNWEYIGVSEDEYDTYVQELAKQGTALELILHAIAESENITITQDEYDAACEKYADYGYDSREDFERFYGSDFIIETLLSEEVVDFLEENAMIVEVNE